MVLSRRRPGRPRPGEPRLSRSAILEAALRIVDEDGIAALTMRRLAADLGVNPMSIYHHLPGKAAVLAGTVEHVFSRLPVPAGDGPWQERLTSAAHAYRRIVRAHPNLALQIISDPAAVSGALVAAGEPFYAALEQAGLPPRAIVEAVDTVIDFIHGFMLGEAASASGTFELGPDLLARVSGLPPETAPALTRVAEALGESGLRYEFDRGFEAGLAILIKGIEAIAASRPSIG
jgi:AcrR family transcriptional regulator